MRPGFAFDRGLSMILLLSALAAGCSAELASPSAPGSPSPAPPPTRFTLSGRVTETPPTSLTGIAGATVTITPAPDGNHVTTTSRLGFYSISNVAAGSIIRVSAEGYVETTTISEMGEANFQLMPVPRMMETKLSDTLGAEVGTCSDGLSMKPCHILTIAIHNAGPLEATLVWDPPGEADLNLTLFRTGAPDFIARSASKGAAPEHMTALLSEGATYELRVTYASGTDAPRYTLHVMHQS